MPTGRQLENLPSLIMYRYRFSRGFVSDSLTLPLDYCPEFTEVIEPGDHSGVVREKHRVQNAPCSYCICLCFFLCGRVPYLLAQRNINEAVRCPYIECGNVLIVRREMTNEPALKLRHKELIITI